MLNHDQAIATAAFYAGKAMQLEVLLGQHQRTVEELGQRLQLAQKELAEAQQKLQQPKPNVLSGQQCGLVDDLLAQSPGLSE